MDQEKMMRQRSSKSEAPVRFESPGPACGTRHGLVLRNQWRVTMSRYPGRLLPTSLIVTVLVLAALAGGERRANAQITGLATDNSNSSGSVSSGTGQNLCTTNVFGTVAPLGGNIGESRNIVNITASSPTSFTTRFVADLCTDSGGSTISSVLTFSCDPGANSELLSVDSRTNFGVLAPSGTNYRLTVTNKISGEADVNNDGGGAPTDQVSTVSTAVSGAPQFGGGTLNLTSGLPINISSGSAPFNTTSASVKFVGAGTGGSAAQQVRSVWSASCSTPDNGQECGIRIGLPCSITGGAALVGDTTFGPGGLYPGSPTRDQTQDGHFVTVGLEFCGDGIVQQDGVLNEACDNGLDPVTGNGGTNSCCSANCQVVSNGTTCRSVAGECDLAEVCNGVSPVCPTDVKKANNTPCTDDGNPCSNDICNGASNTCQHPAGHAGSVCRASIDAQCDPQEVCTGASTACPADVHQADTLPCASDGNPCTSDHCSNSSGTCVHTAANPGTVCRAATDVCDVAETCTGTSTACPADAVAAVNTSCPDDGKLCTHDICDGTSKACTHPGANAGEVCRPAVGDGSCDFDEVCDGVSQDCPADVVAAAGIRCRDEAGPCDVPEYCDGTSGFCPADGKQPVNFVCRPQIGGADGVCDVAEVCDGVSDACPPDGVEPQGTVCRAAAGDCDVAEVCDGTLKTCPADQLASSAVVCRDVAPGAAGICDVPEYCTGTFQNCPFDEKVPTFGLNCRPAVSMCDVDEYCDGANNTCPTDTFAPPQTCRASAGICDAEESCTGTSASCPPDSFLPSSTLCRGVAGICDVQENCTGSSAACPVDTFKSTTTICRGADSSGCDVDDHCSGTDSACPPDAKEPDGFQCVGTNPNTCLNACVTGVCTDACPGSGDINNPAPNAVCPIPGTHVVPQCCGNGLVEGGEQCDDGNQVSGGDACPSLPSDDCQLGASSGLIRGNTRNPATDKGGCQVEYSVLNPWAVPDRFGQPNMIQVCEDQDPTCDLDPRPGRCRFHVVACLNNADPNLPSCTPDGLNSLVIINRPYLKKSSPQLSLVGGNIATLSHNLQALYDPANPGLGFSLSPPLSAAQQGLCTGGMLVDVYASNASPNQSLSSSQLFRVKSKNNLARPRRNASALRLICTARPLPH